MKKFYTCVLVVILSLSMIFAGCGDDKNKKTDNTSVSTIENSEQNNEQKEQQSNVSNIQGKPVSQCFDSITGVSQEWKDGLYVVNGEDKNGQMICGIMDENGNVEIFDGYTALYPLADGHLIATADTEVCGDCNFYGKAIANKEVGIPGVIIDENKNIIYEPDESNGYERLYQISDKTILAIQAKKGFEDVEITTRLINQDGKTNSVLEVIHPSCFYSGSRNAILFDDDGKKWHLGTIIVERGKSDELGDNAHLKLYLFGEGGWIIDFWASDTGMASWSRIDNENEKLTFGVFDSQTKYSKPTWVFDRISDDNPELPAILNLQNSLSANDKLDYMGKFDVTDDKTALFLCRYGNSKNYEYRIYDSEGKEVQISEEYLSKIESYEFLDGKLFLALNSNNQLFGVLINRDGSIYKDAFMLDDDSEIITLENDVLKYRVDNKIYDFDVQQEKNIKEIAVTETLENGAELDNIEVMDNFIIAEYKKIVSSEVKDYFYEIYDLNGNKIS